MAYLLDSNIFIQAKNMHYGFDFCPAFWDWLLKENSNGKVYSITKVGDELIAGDDELADWAKERTDGFFLPMKPEMVQRMAEVSLWVTRQSYTRCLRRPRHQDDDTVRDAQERKSPIRA